MEDQGHHRRIPALFLALGLVAGFLAFSTGTGIGLVGRAEGRYASLAAEMVRSGDYLTPRLNGVKHFEKPPLAIWAMAGSLRLFGKSERAVRLPGVLAALLGLWAVYLLAAGGNSSRRALWAALLAAASPLLALQARAVTTDIYLMAASAFTLMFARRALDAGADQAARSRAFTQAALFSALGFLIKGPVIWLLTLLPVMVEMIWSGRRSELRMVFAWRRMVLFWAVVLPWFVAVGWKNPGLLSWFVRERAVGALFSSGDFHSGPWYFYLPVVVVGFLPAVAILLVAGRRAWTLLLTERRHRLLVCAWLFPLIVFSFSASKLTSYMVPLIVPVAVLGADLLAGGYARRGAFAAAAGALILAGVITASGWQRGWIEHVTAGEIRRLAVVLGMIVAGAGTGVILAMKNRERIALPLIAILQVVGLATVFSVPAVALGRSTREIALEAGRLAADGRPIICYETLLRALPFYTGRNARVVGYYPEGKLDEHERATVAVQPGRELRELVGRGPALIICNPQRLDELAREGLGPLTEVMRSGRFVLLSTEPLPAAAAASTTP